MFAFDKLKPEKQKHILNSAMQEFAAKGYDAASTNAITQSAGISKGLLFHYFGNKENLYFYLMEYSQTLMKESLDPQSDPGDLLTWMSELMLQKARVFQEFPFVFAFLSAVYKEDSPKVLSKIQSKYQREHLAQQHALYQQFDRSYFKPEVEFDKAYFTLMNTLEKVFHRAFAEKPDDFEHLRTQLQEYLDFFRLMFYKDPYKKR